jgi:hypothetical protein
MHGLNAAHPLDSDEGCPQPHTHVPTPGAGCRAPRANLTHSNTNLLGAGVSSEMNGAESASEMRLGDRQHRRGEAHPLGARASTSHALHLHLLCLSRIVHAHVTLTQQQHSRAASAPQKHPADGWASPGSSRGGGTGATPRAQRRAAYCRGVRAPLRGCECSLSLSLLRRVPAARGGESGVHCRCARSVLSSAKPCVDEASTVRLRPDEAASQAPVPELSDSRLRIGTPSAAQAQASHPSSAPTFAHRTTCAALDCSASVLSTTSTRR